MWSIVQVVAAVVLLAGTEQEDVRYAEEHYKLYSNGSRQFEADPAATGELQAGYDESMQWLADAQQRYAEAIAARAPAGRLLQPKLKNLETGLRSFARKRDGFLESYAAELQRALKSKNQDGLQRARSMTELFEALKGKDDPQVKAARSQVEALAAAMVQAKQENSASKTTAPKTATPNPSRPPLPTRSKGPKVDRVLAAMPTDKYSGQDREELRKMVLEAWREKHASDEVLAVVLGMKDWKRTVKKTLDADGKSVQLNDTSVLAAQVFVKKDDRSAYVFMAFINRDNLSENIRNVGCDTKTGAYVVEEIPLELVKK